MKIEFWSDIVCPYCGLMDHRLRLALERFEHADDVQVVHRSFQLHPDLPRAGVTQRRLLEMAGMPAADRRADLCARSRTPPTPRGWTPTRAGADARPDRPTPTNCSPTPPTRAGATRSGRRCSAPTSGRPASCGPSTRSSTSPPRSGLDRDEAAAALRERRYRARVAADQREAERLGARGAPFLVLDGTYAIPGAVGTDDLLAAMTEAWQESHPARAAPGPRRSRRRLRPGRLLLNGVFHEPNHRST